MLLSELQGTCAGLAVLLWLERLQTMLESCVRMQSWVVHVLVRQRGARLIGGTTPVHMVGCMTLAYVQRHVIQRDAMMGCSMSYTGTVKHGVTM